MEIKLYQGLLEFNWNLLFSAITVLVLYLILKRFFFAKVHCIMAERQAMIEEKLIHAEEKSQKAEALLTEYSQTLAAAEEEKRQIIKDARMQARKQADTIMDDARRQADQLLVQTGEKLKTEEEKAQTRLHKEVAALAALAAGKLLEKELSIDGQEALIDKTLQEAEAGGWQMH